jgi:peptide/nickel transport system substrate-binding protein
VSNETRGPLTPTEPGSARDGEGGTTRRDFLVKAGVVGASFSTLGGVASWAGSASASTKRHATRAVKGGTVTVGADAVGVDFVPTHIYQGRGHEIILLALFEGLYTYPNGDVSKPYQSVLATGLPTVSSDGLKYTVNLRKGVKFHDGTPFNADAVVFNYMRYLDKSHPYYDVNAGANVPATFLLGIGKVEALGAYTVRFTATTQLGDFIASILPDNGVMSPTAVKAAGVANAGLKPVGTGPFQFVEALKGDHVTLAAFDDYWGGQPTIDKLVVREIPDPRTLTASILSGEVDISTFVEHSDIPLFKKNTSKYTVAVLPSVVTGYMGLNAAGSGGFDALSDVRLRQAACHAIDKSKLIKLAFLGYGAVGAGICPPASWGYQKSLYDYNNYDPVKAKSLISAAGGAPSLTLLASSSGYFPQMAEIIQNDLNAVGFSTTINTLDASVYYGTINQGKQDICLGEGAPDVFSPYSLYKTFFGCGGTRIGRWGNWCDPGFDHAVNQLFGESKRGTDIKLIKALDSELLKNAIFQTNYYPSEVTIWNNRLQNVVPLSVDELACFKGVTVRA